MTSTPSDFVTTFDAERNRLIALTQRGIGMPVAGMLFWLGVAWLVRHFPLGQAVFFSFFLTGIVFPIGVGITRLAGGDLFAKSQRLTSLGMLLAALQLFYWPIIFLVAHLNGAWTPWAMAVLFGSHFLPYAWLYRSRAFAFLTISVTVSLSALALITGDPMPTMVPLITAACYAIAVVWMWRENRASNASATR